MKQIIFSCCLLLINLSLFSQIKINEVMTSNTGFLMDSDNDTPDWIELFNSGINPVNLQGYGLSDRVDKPFQWVFPDYNMNPGEYLLVYASGKDRRDPPYFWNTIITQGDEWRYLAPATEPAANWRTGSFNDTAWSIGKSGFGYGDNDDATIITAPNSVFIRKKFIIKDLKDVKQLILHMDYDDGFVAYINGIEVARGQMDGKGAFPRFDVFASAEHEALIYRNIPPEKYTISNFNSVLFTGENVIAVQVHNVNATSSDMTAIPFLSVATSQKPENVRTSPLLNFTATEFHTNFKINAEGETIVLTNASHVLIDSVSVKAIPVNTSYGRTISNPNIWAIFTEPTPLKENIGSGFSGSKAAKPVFSHQGGIYSAPFKLNISVPDKKDTIYYTTDGSEPTKSSLIYSTEITVNNSRVIRARVLKKGLLPGEVTTNTFVMNGNPKLPVVSISMNPADLWDNNTGIYVKGPNAQAANPNYGANFWMDWEKACHFEMIETTGNKVIDIDAGTKIFGGWSRAKAQKSMAFYTRKEYGADKINYKIFKERPFDKFNNIVLRNSGNDWEFTMFRDALMTGLVSDLNIDIQAYRPASVYLNGDYWGLLNLREKVNEHFIASNHNVDPDEITLLEGRGQSIIGSTLEWNTLYSYIENNSLVQDANYQNVVSKIDFENYLNYTISNIYYSNHDWPGNNIKYWKPNAANGKWRWIMFDTDFGMGLYNAPASKNSLSIVTATNSSEWHNQPWATIMLRKLLENTSFRNQFVNRFADMINSSFLPERIYSAIDAKSALISEEMIKHLGRWYSTSYSNWLINVQQMKTFASERPAYVLAHIRQRWNFNSPQVITLYADTIRGSIQCNSLKLSKFPWSGNYFQEVPISLTAIPKAGNRFVRWEGITGPANSRTITVTPQFGLRVTAIFESDGSYNENVVINEISFNNSAKVDPGDWIELYNKGSFDINISGWKITDSDPNHQFIFPENTWLRANEYIVVVNDLVKFEAVFGKIKNTHGTMGFGFSNTNDAIMLYSKTDQLIDEVKYWNSEPWQVYSLSELWSLELINPNFNNNSGLNWVLSEKYGSPGARNPIYIPTNIENNTRLTSKSNVLQNYPNPFVGGTYFEFKLENPGSFSILILDISGKTVRKIAGNTQLSNVQTVFWDGKDFNGRDVDAGVYIYRVDASGFTETKRMVKL